MDYVGAAILAVVIGLSIVGALLLRNEDAVTKAWRKRREGKDPLAPRLAMVFWGLFTILNIALAIDTGGTDRIVMAGLSIVVFERVLRRYRQPRRATG